MKDEEQIELVLMNVDNNNSALKNIDQGLMSNRLGGQPRFPGARESFQKGYAPNSRAATTLNSMQKFYINNQKDMFPPMINTLFL